VLQPHVPPPMIKIEDPFVDGGDIVVVELTEIDKMWRCRTICMRGYVLQWIRVDLPFRPIVRGMHEMRFGPDIMPPLPLLCTE
jgi:hypothetical protein